MKTAEMRKHLEEAMSSAGLKLVEMLTNEEPDEGAINYLCGWLCSVFRVEAEKQATK